MNTRLDAYSLDYATQPDPDLQAWIETLDAQLRSRFGMTPAQTAVGLLDLKTLRLAMIHPDRIEYGASVPKIGILLAFFALEPDRARRLDPQTRRELGLMIKQSSNEIAARFSRQLGLRSVQQELNRLGLYDANHGGGIWVGKHYGAATERIGDPIADHSHAVTVRQLLRYYLWLEQDKLVSPAASETMRQIFASPEIPHIHDKFVQGLEGRTLEIRRKAGWWEDWFHDTAVIVGPNRHYILVALTHHPAGDAYLAALAPAVDDRLVAAGK